MVSGLTKGTKARLNTFKGDLFYICPEAGAGGKVTGSFKS